jgi:hypothetical protein
MADPTVRSQGTFRVRSPGWWAGHVCAHCGQTLAVGAEAVMAVHGPWHVHPAHVACEEHTHA